jgi:hypothetical protein
MENFEIPNTLAVNVCALSNEVQYRKLLLQRVVVVEFELISRFERQFD